jgi:hypothetical protein
MNKHTLPEPIQKSVYNAFPGYNFQGWPTGFGWAPDRHFRATLHRGEITLPVVIRRCWSESGYRIEKYLYENVLKNLQITTPKLYATFDDTIGGTPWLILEDLGAETATNTDVDRIDILRQLAVVHATGVSLISDDDSVLEAFPVNHDFYNQCTKSLRDGFPDIKP